jgi:hypothetical protein
MLDNVDTLLHELGHVFAHVTSLVRSTIVDEIDRDPVKSDQLEKDNEALYSCRRAAELASDR